MAVFKLVSSSMGAGGNYGNRSGSELASLLPVPELAARDSWHDRERETRLVCFPARLSFLCNVGLHHD